MFGAAQRTAAARTAGRTAARKPRSAAVLARLTHRDEGRSAASMTLLRPLPAIALATASVSTLRSAPQGVPSQRIYCLVLASARSCS
eukprot:4043135-Pleurochrysis_carterae.AAC.5